MNDIKKLNRIKVVLVEKDKTSKWLAEQVGKNNYAVSKWCSNVAQPDLQTKAENPDIRSSLLKSLDLVSSIELYQKDDSFIHEPFENLDNWATGDDALFLLEIIGILICIPCKLATAHNLL